MVSSPLLHQQGIGQKIATTSIVTVLYIHESAQQNKTSANFKTFEDLETFGISQKKMNTINFLMSINKVIILVSTNKKFNVRNAVTLKI